MMETPAFDEKTLERVRAAQALTPVLDVRGSRKATYAHIEKVRKNLKLILRNLTERRDRHDASKMEEPELTGYAGLSEALKGLTYGTPEHRAAFEPFKPIIQHHYQANDHHPEHFANGVNDMSLLQIIEMLADWKAANDRNGGDFSQSMQVSIKRFAVGEQLAGIITNTARELGWIKEASDD